jgi:CheY-like chemotaxis protein
MAQLRLLVVEDAPMNRRLIEAIVAELGIRPTLATQGAEALELLRDDPGFDLVLMDVQMPVMDGIEATRAIRAEERLRELPIVATANAMKDDRIIRPGGRDAGLPLEAHRSTSPDRGPAALGMPRNARAVREPSLMPMRAAPPAMSPEPHPATSESPAQATLPLKMP